MIPIVKAMLVVATALGLGIAINSTLPRPKTETICVDTVTPTLRDAAQKALNSIGCTRKPVASKKLAGRGQHVFNNGLLGFHRSVLQDLLEEVGFYDQLEILEHDLMIPLNQNVQNAIRTMVVYFSSDEFYVDYNADVFGEFVRQLRTALVEYLKADTSVIQGGRHGIQKMRQRVQLVATEMVNHDVYVDPMARDRWLQENPGGQSVYNQVRSALQNMFQNILQDFQKVSDKIHDLRRKRQLELERDLN